MLSNYNRTQNRRFHRRFPQVNESELLINYYSCALIAEILLQGHLYISDHYFAFYSNIFGYKTQIIIPICDVVTISKEKTAKIIPNAVGICTKEGKYVFGSLLSRETTFRLLKDVWNKTTNFYVLHNESLTLEYKSNADRIETTEDNPINLNKTRDSSFKTGVKEAFGSSSDSLKRQLNLQLSISSDDSEATTPKDSESEMFSAEESFQLQPIIQLQKVHKKHIKFSKVKRLLKNLKSIPRTSKVLIAISVLLIILCISTLILSYRVHLTYKRLTQENFVLDFRTSKEKNEPFWKFSKLTKNIRYKLFQLAKLRQSLEELFTKIEANEKFCNIMS